MELNEINPEIIRLEERIRSQKRIKFEASLESDYEAWYLKHMVQTGLFHIINVKPPDLIWSMRHHGTHSILKYFTCIDFRMIMEEYFYVVVTNYMP